MSPPSSQGFRVTLISRYFIWKKKKIQSYCDTVRLPLQLVRALEKSGCTSLSVPSTAARGSLQFSFCQVLNGGLYLDFEVLRWSKLVEFLGFTK